MEPDLGGFSRSHGRETSVGGEQQIAVDQEASAAAVDSRHGRSLAGENGALHPLRLAAAVAEAPRLSQNPHFPSPQRQNQHPLRTKSATNLGSKMWGQSQRRRKPISQLPIISLFVSFSLSLSKSKSKSSWLWYISLVTGKNGTRNKLMGKKVSEVGEDRECGKKGNYFIRGKCRGEGASYNGDSIREKKESSE